MASKHLCFLLLAFVASALAQSEDELHIPMENDNQFPPENHSEPDGNIIEGSGLGAIEEPIATTTQPAAPLIEDVQLTALIDNGETASGTGETSCPKPCVCSIEGDTNNYVVDCSGYGLSKFPVHIDEKTTKLNLQNNKLTEIPKEVSSLKKLKELNANDNIIMDLASGSISELPELTTLSLANNRLIEYPKDLKNSFSLINLQELDLGGNDMRTPVTSETFSNFKSLRKLTLPTTSTELLEDLCGSLKANLEAVCTGSCKEQLFECPDASPVLDEELLEAILPGTIAITSILEDSIDPILNSKIMKTNESAIKVKNVEETGKITTELPEAVLPETLIPAVVPEEEEIKTNVSPALRTAIQSGETDKVSPLNAIIEAPKDGKAVNTESDINVGATTSDTKTGGVDKGVIGIIVAGMVLVVAGITIKKNWTSIKNRFGSNPITPNERTAASANGTTPEEVPLQEKSPV